MEDHKISRKKFLGLGAAATGAALFSGIGANAVAQVLPEENKTNLNEYLLINVRLEDGFEYNDKNEVIATKTALYTIHIANGKIKSITTGKSALKLKTVDAKGLLIKRTMAAEPGMQRQEKVIR